MEMDKAFRAIALSPGIFLSLFSGTVPRFFETGWFRALCALLACVMGFGLFRAWEIRQRARRRQLERLVEERTATIAQQAEKLRELDELKSQFFANVSHELRTPLTLTLGPLQDASRRPVRAAAGRISPSRSRWR